MYGFALSRGLSGAGRTSLLKRLRHQSLKRGTSENGILLGGFAEKFLTKCDDATLAEYERIISESDIELFNWLSGVHGTPEKYKDSQLFGMIQEYYQKRKHRNFIPS